MARRTSLEKRSFTMVEVAEILHTAGELRRTDGALAERRGETEQRMAFSELMEIGQELGLSSEHLRAAVPVSDKRMDRAHRAATKKLGFWRHAFTYGIVNAGLVSMDFLDGDPEWWAMYPAIGWGMALLMHAARVYVTHRNGRLYRRLVRQELEP